VVKTGIAGYPYHHIGPCRVALHGLQDVPGLVAVQLIEAAE